MIYKWKVNKYTIDAEDAAKEFELIREENIELTPQHIVDKARDKKSNLHNEFEWDNEIAGEKYRVGQASEMLRTLIVVNEEKENSAPMRAYINVSTMTHQYFPMKIVIETPDLYKQMLEDAKKEMQSFIRKYEMLDELKVISNQIRLFLEDN
jgi:hypothetical protein